MINSNDRRKAPRIEVDFVTVEIVRDHPSTAELTEICTVVNLSISGMRFKSDRKFDQNQLLRLTFLLPESMVIIRTNALIVYHSRMDSGEFSYGVNFKNLGIAEQKLIDHFIQKTLTENNPS